MKIKAAQFAIISAISSLALLAQNVMAANTVTANVNVTVPSVVSLAGSDGVTTSQNLTLNASSIAFDSSLNATGNASITWQGNTNSNNGFQVTCQRAAISGTGTAALQNAIKITGAPAPGGTNTAQILGSYSSGVALPNIGSSTPDQFCSTSAAGSALFNVQLGLNAPSSAGNGSVSTVLTFVAAAL